MSQDDLMRTGEVEVVLELSMQCYGLYYSLHMRSDTNSLGQKP